MVVVYRNRDKYSDSGRGIDRERDSDSESDWDISSYNNIVIVVLKVIGILAMFIVLVI